MSLTDARHAAVATLRAAGIDDPVREAEQLLGAVFPGKYIDYDAIFSEDFARRYRDVVARRAAREPMSHIIGRRAFWNSVFDVSAAVLDPRPDTETLVEAALDVPWKTVLDLGTGSGCILLSLLAERSAATGLGTDISTAALQVAERNCTKLELNDCARFIQSDWFGDIDDRFDLIVSNPPYITAEAYAELQPEVLKFEPKIALTPGGDGLDPYRTIARDAPAHLTPGGTVLVEIGFDQGPVVSGLFSDAGFDDVKVIPDLNGKDRVVTATLR